MAATTITEETVKYNFLCNALQSIRSNLVEGTECSRDIRKRTAEVGLAILREEILSVDQFEQRTSIETLAVEVAEQIAQMPPDAKEVEVNPAAAEFLVQIASQTYCNLLHEAQDSETAKLVNDTCLKILMPRVENVQSIDDRILLLSDFVMQQRQSAHLGEASRAQELSLKVQALRADSGASS